MKFLKIKDGKYEGINYFSEPYFTECINIAEKAINKFCEEKNDEPVDREELKTILAEMGAGSNPSFRVGDAYFHVKSIIEHYVEADGFTLTMKGEKLESFINEEIMDLDISLSDIKTILLIFILATDYPLLYLLSAIHSDINEDIITVVTGNIVSTIEYIMEEIIKAKNLDREVQ